MLSLDVPFTLYGLSKVIASRDHYLSNRTISTSQVKKWTVIGISECALATLLAASIAEFFFRNIAFLISTPLYLTKRGGQVSDRIYASALVSLRVALFSFEALGHNLITDYLWMKILDPKILTYHLKKP